MYQKESICTKIFGTHGACTKIFWYTQRCVPKYIIFSFSSAYKLVYQFFSTYCIVYQKLGILFGTRCNMYHIFGHEDTRIKNIRVSKYFGTYPLYFWYIINLYQNFWYILRYIFRFLVHGDLVTIDVQIHEFLSNE